MRAYQKFVIPLVLVTTLLLTGCEISRTDDSGDLGPVAGQPSTPGAEPPTPEGEQAGATPPPVQPGETPPDISTEVFPAPEAPPATEMEQGKVLVKLNQQASIQARSAELGADNIITAGVPSLDQTLREIGASGLDPVIEPVAEAANEDLETFSAQAEEVEQLYSISFAPENNPVEIAARLEQDPAVEFAEPNFIAGITGRPAEATALTPNDPYYVYQWNLPAIQAPAAWDTTQGEGVIVAVVDTGIDFNAPDLANSRRLPGYDFANEDTDPTDDQGHGTHVAGTIAQSTNNGIGVAGVAYNSTLLPVKVLGSSGQGSYEGIIQGIIYAVDQGADVINLSLAGRNNSLALQEAMQYAYNRGVVVVAAAGNSSGPVEYPAAFDDFVIAVGATGFDNSLAPYSNFGAQIDLVAPGGNIDVDQNNDGFADGILQQTFATSGSGYSYRFFEGTSMASPHIAGVAALLRSLNPNLSPAQVEQILQQTARNLGQTDQFGAGLVQAGAAVQVAQGTGEQIDTPTPTPLPVTPVSPPTDTPTPMPVEPPTATPTPEPGITPTDTPVPEPGITPTATPTPAPITSGPGNELLVNGGFENNEGWIFGDTPVQGSYNTNVVRSGLRSARLGNLGDRYDVFSYSSVWQKVTIPVEAQQVTLTANIYPVSYDQGGRDIQYIGLLGSNGRFIRALSEGLSNSQTWETKTFDLSDFRGQTIYIYFSVLNRGGPAGPSALYVDDVSLSWVK